MLVENRPIIDCDSGLITVATYPLVEFLTKNLTSLKIFFYQRVSSIIGRLPLKVVFHKRLFSIKGRLLSKFIFHQRSSTIEGRLPSKAFFHRRLSLIKGKKTKNVHQKKANHMKDLSVQPNPLK